MHSMEASMALPLGYTAVDLDGRFDVYVLAVVVAVAIVVIGPFLVPLPFLGIHALPQCAEAGKQPGQPGV